MLRLELHGTIRCSAASSPGSKQTKSPSGNVGATALPAKRNKENQVQGLPLRRPKSALVLPRQREVARDYEENRMQGKGRKNAAGGWLLGEMAGRAAGVVSAAAAVVGFAWGLVVGGMPPMANLVQASPWWSVLGSLSCDGTGVRRGGVGLAPDAIHLGFGNSPRKGASGTESNTRLSDPAARSLTT